MMRRICILTSAHPALEVRVFHKEAKTLAHEGYDITLIGQHDEDTAMAGVKIVALSPPKSRFRRIFSTTRKIYDLAKEQRADIYHFHDPELLPWALKLKMETGAKVIYDVHEDFSQAILSREWIPRAFRKSVSRLFRLYEKRTAKKFDYIIAATPGIMGHFRQRNVINVKNYPITNNVFSVNKQQRSRHGSCWSLIYIGGLQRVRGAKEITQALEFIDRERDVQLELAGRFSDADFEKEMRGLKEWRKVRYLGWVPHEQCLKCLAEADIGLVCVHPLRRFATSLPVKMFEYMAAGLPVIASNFPLWKEIVQGNQCGLTVDPLDIEQIARAIEYFIEHPDEARRMGENGRRAVLEKYNWERESKGLLKVYGELCTP